MKHVIIVGGLILGTVAVAALWPAGPQADPNARLAMEESSTAKPAQPEFIPPGTSGMTEQQRQDMNKMMQQTGAMMKEASEQMDAMSEPAYGEPDPSYAD